MFVRVGSGSMFLWYWYFSVGVGVLGSMVGCACFGWALRLATDIVGENAWLLRLWGCRNETWNLPAEQSPAPLMK